MRHTRPKSAILIAAVLALGAAVPALYGVDIWHALLISVISYLVFVPPSHFKSEP